MKTIQLIVIIIYILSGSLIGQKAGNAIKCDGIDDYLLVPHHQSLNPGAGSWTISLWVKELDIVQRAQLVGKRFDVDGYNQYTFGIGDTDPHFPNPGKTLYFNYIDSAGVSERSGHLQGDFVDGNWHHLAFVADNIADSVFIYIDGIKQVTIMQYNFGVWPNIGRLDSLFIARNSSGTHFLNGEIDELTIWNKALTADQINIVMNDTLSAAYYSTADSGLVGYWRFDEYEDLGIGNAGTDDIRDLSIWGNHGDSGGSPLLVPSGILLDVDDNPVSVSGFKLEQNFPNPFNPSTVIKFSLPSSRNVKLIIFDILGRELGTLVDEYKSYGEYEITFNVGPLKSGIYFYQLKAGDFIQTKKMILIK